MYAYWMDELMNAAKADHLRAFEAAERRGLTQRAAARPEKDNAERARRPRPADAPSASSSPASGR